MVNPSRRLVSTLVFMSLAIFGARCTSGKSERVTPTIDGSGAASGDATPDGDSASCTPEMALKRSIAKMKLIESDAMEESTADTSDPCAASEVDSSEADPGADPAATELH